ncbi:uncharacterized protein LOC113294844 [Papaver somniferum]|uniref:uncharacterized protein LOC113294844 n=1 Tax=Papaver somniferum TaxID=3469 RepID=UPI000E6F8F5D|nr:uncharacterized protein LOC113294844 [Papaver somniferum]
MKVAEFIDLNTRSWNIGLLQDYFTQDQVEEILNIIPLTQLEDKMIWSLTTNVNQKLNRYNPAYDDICSRCQEEEESTTHMLIHCNYARSIWNAIFPDITQDLSNTDNIQHWIKTWDKKDSTINFGRQSNVNLIVITMWFIWKTRCELVFEGKHCSINNLKARVYNYCNENKIHTDNQLIQLQVLRSRSNNMENRRHNMNKWSPPLRGRLKINIDAFVLPGNHYAGISLIIRDFTGQLVEAWTLVERVRDITQAEAVAALKALQWIIQLQIQNVIVEGDNKKVMDSINGMCNISP